MIMSNRADLIKQHFDYLINEYGFRIERKEFDPQTMGNAVVVFKSHKYGIEIVIDRDQALISIGDCLNPRMQWFELQDVVTYYAPSIDDVYSFTEKTADNTWDDIIGLQLRKLAIVLRQHCEPVLRGESWIKGEIEKIEESRKTELLKNLRKG